VKRDNASLITLWCAAGLVILTGAGLTVHSLTGLSRRQEIWKKKLDDTRELSVMRDATLRYHALLKQYAQYPAAPTRFEDLARTAVSGLNMSVLQTERRSATDGWTANRLSVELTDISGTDLGKILETGAATRPPWTLLECSLFASPTPGRLAKAKLVVESVERQDPAQ
jgi:hypothetical protein